MGCWYNDVVSGVRQENFRPNGAFSFDGRHCKIVVLERVHGAIVCVLVRRSRGFYRRHHHVVEFALGLGRNRTTSSISP